MGHGAQVPISREREGRSASERRGARAAASGQPAAGGQIATPDRDASARLPTRPDAVGKTQRCTTTSADISASGHGVVHARGMGIKIVRLFEQAGTIGGLVARMRLASMSHVTSMEAETIDDHPDRVARGQSAREESRERSGWAVDERGALEVVGWSEYE